MSEQEDNREQIYDKQINPLMAQIIQICKENNIPFVASFQLTANEDEDGPLLCTSANLPDGSAKCLEQAQDIIYRCEPFYAFTITREQKS